MSNNNRFISVKTQIPGPKTSALLEKRLKFVPKGVGNNTPIFVEKADGALLLDVEANVFLDFEGAIGTINVGHCPPEVVQAIQKQSEQ